MTLPAPNTPLYNHPLPAIEHWLSEIGCQQDRENLNRWTIDRPTWKAELCLDTEELVVCYFNANDNGGDLQRSFKYSLSRQDIEAAILSGP